RLEREGLVQRRQRNEAAQVLEYAVVHAHRFEVLAATVHHPVRDGADATPGEAFEDAVADQGQRAAIGRVGVEPDRERRDPALAEVGRGATDALHLAVPQRPARQWINAAVVDRE